MDKKIGGFPKIFTIGQKYILDIFKGEVEVTEKIDGSQFNFGKTDGIVHMRSKNAIVHRGAEGMFRLAAKHVYNIESMLPKDTIYHCEYLMKPKHNVLKYNQVPPNNLICFGVSHPDGTFRKDYERLASALDLWSVPVLFQGKIDSIEKIKNFLELESVLGGTPIEGIVVKNYEVPVILGGKIYDIMCGKYVSEGFKEKYRTEARWAKGVQIVREFGKLEDSPRDIGEIIKTIHDDITDECEDEFKEALWKIYRGKLLRRSTAGFPEWYKDKLAGKSFAG
jgi:hypothetical protein